MALMADSLEMHSRILAFALLVLISMFMGAQSEMEPECPGPCPFDDFDEDRLISDCTAQCNTTFGDPDAAQECISACSDWQDSVSCTATPLVSRRSPTILGRRRRASSETLSIPTYQQSEDKADHAHAEDGTDDQLDLSLERRDLNSCIRNCQSFHIISICPGNAPALIAQSAM